MGWATTELDTLTDGELHSRVVELQRLDSVLASERARTIGAWDARRLYAFDGSKAPSARLARDCRLSAAGARAEIRRGRCLRAMPFTAAALAAGEITVDHVNELIPLTKPEFAELFMRDEELLVEQAKTLRFRDFRRAVAYWRMRADATLAEDKADRQRAGRYLDITRTFADTIDIKGLLDPVDGTIVLNELQRIEQRLFKADWDAAKAIHGDDTRIEHLDRTPKQRRADALVEVARRSAAMTSDHHPARPLLSVLVGYETFAGPICELFDGTVVTPGQVAPLLSEADIERVVFDPTSRDITDIGERRRFFTGAIRRVLELRDRGCTFPGCDEPAERCEADHITPWSHGGTTTITNGRLLCSYHNKQRNHERPPPAGP